MPRGRYVHKLRPEPYDCSRCGKSIAKSSTNEGSAQGLFMNHLKWRHPEEFKRRMDERRTAYQLVSIMEKSRRRSFDIIFTTPKFKSEGS